MAFQPMSHITAGHGASSWDPFQGLAKAVDAGVQARNRYKYFKDAHDAARNEEPEQETPGTVRETPTPANTGAPLPGHRQRGSNITPESTGAPVPGTLKQTTDRIPAKSTRRFPKMDKKQTAPGTRPKRK